MTNPGERPNTITREFILARCTNVQWVTPEFAAKIAESWRFQSRSSVISERDSRIYGLIADMFEA